jgi:ATP-dependent protease ClpP protease subunit
MYKFNNLATFGEPIGFRYTVNLDRDITDPDDFREEILVIRNSTENDIVHILISSGGGQVETMKTILSAIAQTKAHVITEITGDIASAATFIFLAGDEYLVSDDAYMMCHSVSFGSVGKSNDVKRHVDFTHDMGRRLVYKYYEGFFTKEEMEDLLRGEEFWIGAEEIMERLSNRNKAIESQIAEDYSESDMSVVYEQMREQLENYAEMFGISYEEILDNLSTQDVDEVSVFEFDVDELKRTGDINYVKMVADCLDIGYAPNIGLFKLRKRVLDELL